MPQFNREARAVCQFCLHGGKHNATLTDKKNLSVRKPSGGPSDTLLKKEGRKEGLQVPRITS